MHGSSSFSTPDYNGRTFPLRREKNYRTFRGTSHRPQRQVTFAPTKIRDRYGNVMHCSFCNSWFHLFRDCPEKERTGMHFNEEQTVEEQQHTEHT